MGAGRELVIPIVARIVEIAQASPGTFPLVNGAPNRVGRLRGYGNSLVAPQAQVFIEAYLEVLNNG